MSTPLTLEAIGGILVGGLDTLDPSDRLAVEYSLLLGWRAALKQAGDGEVDLKAIIDTIAQVGWNTTDAGTRSLTTSVGKIAQAFSPDLPPGMPAAVAAGGAAVTAWEQGTRGDPIVGFASSDPGGPSLTLLQPSVSLPPRTVLWFTPAPQVTVRMSAASLRLNPGVYDQIAETIADKVKPYLGDLVP